MCSISPRSRSRFFETFGVARAGSSARPSRLIWNSALNSALQAAGGTQTRNITDHILVQLEASQRSWQTSITPMGGFQEQRLEINESFKVLNASKSLKWRYSFSLSSVIRTRGRRHASCSASMSATGTPRAPLCPGLHAPAVSHTLNRLPRPPLSSGRGISDGVSM